MSEAVVEVKVLFFATFKDLVGVRQISLELPSGSTVLDLKNLLEKRYAALEKALGTAVVAVNHEFSDDADILPPGAEAAIFPPVSGGSGTYPTVFSITQSELDLDALLAQITLPSTGAACIFTGMVRGVTLRGEPHTTTFLEYEAYLPMAEKKLQQVAQEIRARWPSVEGIAIVQRVGKLSPGTPTVLVACTAPHRDTGVFEAARYGIDRLKEIVPVWKREVGPDGAEWVEGNYLPTKED